LLGLEAFTLCRSYVPIFTQEFPVLFLTPSYPEVREGLGDL